MSALAPDRSLEQRRTSLARANDVRIRRARLKERLKAQQEGVVPILLDPPDWLGTMKVEDLLRAAPQFGPARVRNGLRRAGVSQSKTIAGLTPRQRAAIVEWISR